MLPQRFIRTAVPLLLAVAVIATVVIVRNATHETYTVSAVFDNVKGLVPGNKVVAGGAQVGRISKIELGRDGYPRVDLEVEHNFALRQGATADIQVNSLAGEVNRYILLRAGSGPVLHDRATIGLARTDQPVEVDDLFRTLDPKTRADVRGVLEELNLATEGRGPDLARATALGAHSLNEGTRLLQEINADGLALHALLRNSHIALRAIARNPGAASSFVDGLAGTLETTARRKSELAASIERTPAALRSTRFALDRLDRAVPTLRSFVAVARPTARELTPTARELRPTARQLRPALASTHRLIQDSPSDLRALLPLLRTSSRFLTLADPVLCSSNPILDDVRVFTPELTSGVVHVAGTTSAYDANGHTVRVPAVSQDPPAEEIGPDLPGPGSVKPPFFRNPGIAYPTLQPWPDFEKSFLSDPHERCSR
jgi:virulence factor Mce-like protein